MWDNPRALNAIANTLFAAAMLLAVYGAGHFAMRLPVFALREVQISAPLARVASEEVETAVRHGISGNFFTLDLNTARSAFEALPWVRTAQARRRWPDRLEVALEEHVALARWGTSGLVNTHGELFNAAYDSAPAGTSRASGASRSKDLGLPLFVGPPGSAKEIAIQYDYFKRSLEATGRVPVQVQLSARRAWQVRLDSGLVIELGRENIESRLDRFIAAYNSGAANLRGRLDYVDLRYSNGFAVRAPEMNTELRSTQHATRNTKRS